MFGRILVARERLLIQWGL